MDKYAFCIGGLVCVLISLYIIRLSLMVRRWPKTSGVIVSKEVEYNTTRTELQARPAFRFEPIVKYQYQVNNQNYIGHLVTYPVNWLNSKKDVQNFLNQLPDQVQVHYNPQHPDVACLFPIGLFWPFFGFFMGLFFVLLGGVRFLN